MQEVFIKKYWEEEDIWFYIHFLNQRAIRQIELSNGKRIFLTLDLPKKGESMLYDQSIEDLDLNDSDYISKEEFEKEWQG
ncbi:hypothetical protein [Chryseobacterium cheonjiense]|uniref:EF-hand domain-containing protein n=1 Tax=Chryseobacterium cheonjiense TaxID=2728845 RepID=A0A7Y0A9D9_9FLAO|nr:hypothetical protein [Chryseobacterium cheonjiense]NML59090.1 hypothetical protein [Chryseobacterium cheonjiense]